MDHSSPYHTEAWAEYGVGVVVILARLFARVKVVGFKNWQGDDYFTIIALLFWTGELTMLELIGQYRTNIGLSDEERAAMSPDQTARLALGSKCLMAVWTCYVTLLWSLKACMLFFYNRLTLGLTQQKLVKLNAVLSAGTYIALLFTIFLHCRPLSRHFQVYPDPGLNCTVDYVNYVAVAVTNVVTDAILLCIPIPLLAKVRLELRRKIIIGTLLCGGVFIMMATVLRCVLSLQSIDNINACTIWAIRESFVAILAVNAPCIKPLFSSSTWLRSSSKDPSSSRQLYGKSDGNSSGVSGLSREKHPAMDSTALSQPGRESDEFGMLRETHIESTAPAVRGDQDGLEDEEAGMKGGIQVTTLYEVRSSRQ
ncbi:hypothetical protein BDW62DRAFT_215975 [Aspergillus aurantiobrunneus]